MQMNELADPPLDAAPALASPEIFQTLGHITRQLHDTLNQLGVMPKLQHSAQRLPDARGRLEYVVAKTGEAAEKVLNSFELAKQEHSEIAAATRRLAQAITADPVKALASGAVLNYVGDVEAATARIDDHLTDIMMAQDFHDLTGQVLGKVVTLAIDLEDSLVKLLVQAAPAELVAPVDVAGPSGPAMNAQDRVDVVSNQSEVDDLLASMGF